MEMFFLRPAIRFELEAQHKQKMENLKTQFEFDLFGFW